jgi:hypothetical protein
VIGIWRFSRDIRDIRGGFGGHHLKRTSVDGRQLGDFEFLLGLCPVVIVMATLSLAFLVFARDLRFLGDLCGELCGEFLF